MTSLPLRRCDEKCEYYLQRKDENKGICTYTPQAIEVTRSSDCQHDFVSNKTLRKLAQSTEVVLADIFTEGRVLTKTRKEVKEELGLD